MCQRDFCLFIHLVPKLYILFELTNLVAFCWIVSWFKMSYKRVNDFRIYDGFFHENMRNNTTDMNVLHDFTCSGFFMIWAEERNETEY